MSFDELKSLLEENIPNAIVEITGFGCDLTLNIISDELLALNPVKRQQRIYQVLQPLIADGTLHAVNMRFFSPQIWSNQ